MQIDEILNHFNQPKGQFPKEALNAALNQQEEITPHLLAILNNTLEHPYQVKPSQMDYIFSLYILSKFREQKAFPSILAFASLPSELLEELLGDCLTEGLARFIVSTFNGDFLAIKAVIENPKINRWCRNAALNSLIGLVAMDKMKRDQLIDYLRSLFQSKLAEDETFTTSLVNTASDIYPEELLDEINLAFDKKKVDLGVVNRKWIAQTLKKGKESCLSEYVYNDCNHQPINDVEDSIGWMGVFQEPHPVSYFNTSTNDHFITNNDNTYMRGTQKLGRNEPCPCGSGKKYKKCCLN